MKRLHKRKLIAAFAVSVLIAACVAPGPGSGRLHRWWSGLGPVLPHESFPGDCTICHVGASWNQLVVNFRFDHEKQTGVRLDGAHARAKCLRCHNDRGPVASFHAKGCAGCHQDRHAGQLGTDCSSCHQESSWRPVGQLAMHNRTRFPLSGAHASVSCQRCHPGGWVGDFTPTDSDCVTCHQLELARTTNPPHLGLGWTDSCQRCHIPTRWKHGVIR